MQMISKELFQQWLLLPVLLFFLIMGIFGILIGAGLIVYGARTLRLFGVVNSWVSLRLVTKPLDIPRDITPGIRSFLQRYRRFCAILIVAAAAYLAFILSMRVDILAFSNLVSLKWHVPGAFVFWIADSARWCLVIGSVAAVAVGILLEFHPNVLNVIEKNSARWWTPRKLNKSGDKMYFALDKWVAGNPMRAGWIILVISLIEVCATAALLSRSLPYTA